MTKPIEHFIVRFKDGSVRKIVVGDGQGFFREEMFKGKDKSFVTYECFVADGDIKIIQPATEVSIRTEDELRPQ